MKGTITLMLLVTLVFAGIAGYYFLEHQHVSDRQASLLDNIARIQEEIREKEGQIARLQAELAQAGQAVEGSKAEALRWQQEAAKVSESRAPLEQQLRELTERLAAARTDPTPAPATTNSVEGIESALRPVADGGKLRIEKRGAARIITLQSRELFGPGPADLLDGGRKLLDEVARALAASGNPPVRVEAHTDDVPIGPKFSKQFPSNLELSKARAELVGRVLAEAAGLPAERLATAGLGDKRPVGPNDTPESRARNSRVEISAAP